jgi:hypothetical protein
VGDQRESAIITTPGHAGGSNHQQAWNGVKGTLLHRLDAGSLAFNQAAPKRNIAAPK